MNPVVTLGALNLFMLAVVFVAFLADGAKVSFVIECSAVRTEILFLVPGQVPRLPSSHATTSAANTRQAHPGHVTVQRLGVSWAQT